MIRMTRARRGLQAAAVTVAALGLMAAVALPAAATPTPTGSPTATPTPTAAPTSTPAPTSAPKPTASPKAIDVPTPIQPAASTADAWALKPYMGWSSYSMQVYSGNAKWITADQIIAQSDAMKAKLSKAGYDYINVDSGWNDGPDANGRPTPSATLYPQGLKKVIDHVHANGQKFGLYLIPGISPDVYEKAYPIANAPGCTTHDIVKQPTQQSDYWKIGYRIDFSNPCAQKYVDSIVDQLAAWGVNFVKFDSVTPGSGISDGSVDARDDVAAWSKALKKHNIWFELSWALDINNADYWKQYANGWRVEWDVECYCGGEALTQWDNINRLFPRAADWWRHAGPGGWNDFDSLDVGNGKMDGLTPDERRTATTLWAISAAPMYTGNDLTNLDQLGVDLLTNPEVVAVDQAGVPARPVSTASKQQVWYALNADGSYTVALFNLGRAESDVTAKWSDIGLKGGATVRDLWARKDLGRADNGFTASDVPIHGVRLLKVTPDKGSTVTVNDDALGMKYGGTWTRNGGAEVAATSQPLTMNVTDTGNPAPSTSTGPTRTTSVNDTDPGIVYSGQWGYSSGRNYGDYQNDVHYAEHPGSDSFSYTFTGTGVSYLTEIDSSEGDADVYIDGQLVKTISAYSDPSAPHVPQQTVFTTKGLTNGQHTLRVVMKSGTFMLIDRLDVLQPNLIDPSSVSFDTKAPAAASFAVLRDPDEFTGITANGKALAKGADYTVSGT
ncbi:MAG: alpha-galactosidase, partial [Frankiaceae bacterium]|nr:alpha-galactosidase [Frankiaceae bacterium]